MTKTYGVELEFADVKKGAALPDGAQWDYDDNTIVNSNGIANDNEGTLYNLGGEINTRPTDTIYEQITHIEKIIHVVRPVVNYRCNLHIHIGIPGLKDDLSECKRLFNYFQKNYQEIFLMTEQLPYPKETSKIKAAAEKKRLQRIKVSHQYMLPPERVERIMASKTTQEFLDEHAPLTDKGRMWFFSPRPGINMRQLWETGTIEFRHFPGTDNLYEIESAIMWCSKIVECPKDLREILSSYPFKFPKFKPYNYEQEYCYQWTSVAKNSRREVANRLAILRNKMDIYHCTLNEVYETIVRLCR